MEYRSISVRKKSKESTMMLGLNETIDQLTMANNVRWYWHVLMREDGNVLRNALDIEVECQRKKWRQKRTCKKHFEEESIKVGVSRKDKLCQSKWIVEVNQIDTRLR